MTIEFHRRMARDQRLALSLRAMRGSSTYLLHGNPELVNRRFELIRRENDERNRNMLAGLAAGRRS